MIQKPTPCPLTYKQVVDRYFLEHRAKVIDVAAYLDRLDRTTEPGQDYRDQALRQCIEVLIDGQPDRARRVLELLSDHTTEPIAKAHTQGATGAPQPQTQD